MVSLLATLLQPHNLLYLLLLFGIIRLWRVRPPIPRQRLLWVTVPFLLLSVLSVPAVGYLGFWGLEHRYPYLAQRPDDVQAIVVLSGYQKPPDATHPGGELGEDTVFRCLRAAELYHQGPRLPIVASGGLVEADTPGPTLGQAMRAFLRKLGVADADILVEDRSRNTYENALYSAELLRQHGLGRVLLVTDANSLLRAELSFRKQGCDVIPCGCYYRTGAFDPGLGDFLPSPASMGQFELVVHEWLGLAWYRLCGRI